MRIQNALRLSVVVLCVLFSSCKDDDGGSSVDKYTVHKYKVAVLAHGSALPRFQRNAEWALQNIADAQVGMSDRVKLELTFKNQEDSDIAEYMQQIAEDPEVVAIVGPTTSSLAEQMAVQLGKRKTNNKPMITPTATHVQYQRVFANVPYVWNLAESDITELEVVISKIASLHTANDITLELLTKDYGTSGATNDNAEWFSFIAEEYGLQVSAIHLYKNMDDLRRLVHEISGPEYEKCRKILFFSPDVDEDAIVFDEELGKYMDELEEDDEFCYLPHKIYCSDGFVSDGIAAKVCNYDYEGVDLHASPENGFVQAYHQRFGETMVNGEAQFFDALYMLAYAATLQQYSGQTLNDALLSLVDGDAARGGSWLPYDMTRNFQMLSEGICPDIDGASSNWNFDKKTHATVTGSTYRRWRLIDGQYITTEYVSTEGSRRSSSAKTMWDWRASKMQTFSAEAGTSITYPDVHHRWALLIAASKEWKNYRFQADVFAMHKLLREHGYLDDHIVLICEDDLAYHPNNPHQGELRISDTGPNLYNASAIDYKLSSLKPEDIGDILQGKESERLPHVLHPDKDDNVLIFWSSHGSPGSMDFGGTQTMYYSTMKEILANTPHRKMLFAIEACYSGGLGAACTGLPGVLFITAANPYETSHADVWSNDVGVYLSNGFTRGFQEAIDSNPAVNLRDLYYSLARNTTGSHVKVYNDANFGSVYRENMQEFLK